MTQPAGVPQSIEAVLSSTLLAAVKEYCQTNVSDTDESKADHVILGKPGSELSDKVVVSVHMQHPFGPVMDKDTNQTGLSGGLSMDPYAFPAETIGGMRVDKIIGCVQINIREDMPPDEAAWINGAVKERVRVAINEHPSLHDLADDFGNHLWKIETFRAVGYDSGGSDVSVHFRWIDFRAYVSYTNIRQQQPLTV